MAIRKEIVDELLKDVDPKAVFSSEGLLSEIKKALAERMLNAELDQHLESEAAAAAEGAGAGNHRNGYSKKMVITDTGQVDLDIPRDRRGTFEPQLIARYQRRFPGFDDKIISMYARGMSVRNIQGHLRELYGIEASPQLVSTVTDAVLGEVGRWQARPLGALYPVVFSDALRVKMRDEGTVRNKAVYLAIGVGADGRKDVLGIWIEQTEGAKFWLRVMTELKSRGVQDLLIAVVDGLKGFPDAINAVFPQAQIQTCIVHRLRNSMDYAGWKGRKPIAMALKAVYRAVDAEAAASALTEFEEGPWGRKYPAITAAWRRNWSEVIPFFAFPQEVRRIVYTTNAIESLNSTIRRSVRTRRHFPSEEAAIKHIWLQLREVTKDWKMPAREWHAPRPSSRCCSLTGSTCISKPTGPPHTTFLTPPATGFSGLSTLVSDVEDGRPVSKPAPEVAPPPPEPPPTRAEEAPAASSVPQPPKGKSASSSDVTTGKWMVGIGLAISLLLIVFVSATKSESTRSTTAPVAQAPTTAVPAYCPASTAALITPKRQPAQDAIIQQSADTESVNVLGQQIAFSNPSGYCTPGKSAREIELMSVASRSLGEGSRLVHAAVRCSELEDYVRDFL